MTDEYAPDLDDQNSAVPAVGRSAPAKRSFMGRHKALTALVVLVSMLGALVLGAVLFVNSKLAQIQHVDISALPDSQRPPRATGAAGDALNILLAGVDNGNGPSVADAWKQHDWVPGEHRSDTIMFLHISADRKQSYVLSVPRDSYVTIYDQNGNPAGKHKINAAFSLYGPSAYVSTMEHLTGIRMDHLAVIDWNGFEDLTNALGGVRIYIPATVYDSSQKITWSKGYHYMYGDEALSYVRTRHGLAGGDFDRIKRQQNFIRVLMNGLLDKGLLTHPQELSSALSAVTKNLTVDSGWSNSNLRGLAFALRGMHAADVTFLTAPLAADWNHYVSGDGDVVLLDPARDGELWRAVSGDRLSEYLSTHTSSQLPSDRYVH
jgi:LCP family protein required for cell wall assembly